MIIVPCQQARWQHQPRLGFGRAVHDSALNLNPKPESDKKKVADFDVRESTFQF